MWPGVLYNNKCGSGGFEGEYAVTKSSCPMVMMDEDASHHALRPNTDRRTNVL